MRVDLRTYTTDPERTVARAAKICYADDIDEVSLCDSDVKKMIKKLLDSNHLSPFEHASFTFLVRGISRTCSHQLVRHRIGVSFSQRSQRYIKEICKSVEWEKIMSGNYNEKDLWFVIPPKIKNNTVALLDYTRSMERCMDRYQDLLDEGIKPEDARFVLPNACKTDIFVTMNARALFNFFDLRMDSHAQWEIRKLAGLMLDECELIAPYIFEGVRK